MTVWGRAIRGSRAPTYFGIGDDVRSASWPCIDAYGRKPDAAFCLTDENPMNKQPGKGEEYGKARSDEEPESPGMGSHTG